MPKRLPQEIRNQIINLYQSGLSITKIAEQIGKPYPTITYVLKQEVSYKNPRPCQGNIDYFETIDSHSKAYILGFIAADGCVSFNKKKNLYSFKIRLNLKDSDFIYFLKSEIGFDTKIQNISYFDRRTNKTYNIISVSLGNQKLCKDLIKLGIVERKTYNLDNFLLNIPIQYRKSAILGYFDGDGHISNVKDKRIKNENYLPCKISICGTYSILQGIIDELSLSSSIFNKGSYCDLLITNRIDFYKFYNCYENLSFFLKRKHDKFIKKINYDDSLGKKIV